MMIREGLRPYIAAQFKLVVSSGIPLARPLAWDFPEDETARKTCGLDEDCPAETQQMFGPELMIAPQLHLGATSRQVYLPKLPAGRVWHYWFTNSSLGSGGNTITQQTPLSGGEFPLYRIVAGSSPTPPPSPGPPSPGSHSYEDVGIGFCLDASGKRPQTILCEDSSVRYVSECQCPSNSLACVALCDGDSACTGYVLQDMSMYGKPKTCQLVTSHKPTVQAHWAVQDAGNGLAIDHHDGEKRDHCFKKASHGPTPTPAPVAVTRIWATVSAPIAPGSGQKRSFVTLRPVLHAGVVRCAVHGRCSLHGFHVAKYVGPDDVQPRDTKRTSW